MGVTCQDALAYICSVQTGFAKEQRGDDTRYADGFCWVCDPDPVWVTSLDLSEATDCTPAHASVKLGQLMNGKKLVREKLPQEGRGRPRYAYAPNHWGIKFAKYKGLME